MPDGTYSLPDLCDLAAVTPRTVRYYIAQGLLRSPGTTGPGARYDDGHLARLRLIRRLQREHLPLAEIRNRLAALSDEEAIAQAGGPVDSPADSALDYVRSALGARALRLSESRSTAPPTGEPASPIAPGPAPASLARARPPASIAATRPAPRDLSGDSAVRESALLYRSEVLPDVQPQPQDEIAGQLPDRSTWERIALAPGVELHLRRPLTRFQNRAVGQLVAFARRLFEEEL